MSQFFNARRRATHPQRAGGRGRPADVDGAAVGGVGFSGARALPRGAGVTSDTRQGGGGGGGGECCAESGGENTSKIKTGKSWARREVQVMHGSHIWISPVAFLSRELDLHATITLTVSRERRQRQLCD
jgi:hypothetical protein